MVHMISNHPDVIHATCPQQHQYAYILSPSGFGWCMKCQRHSPATFAAHATLKQLEDAGKGGHIDGGHQWE